MALIAVAAYAPATQVITLTVTTAPTAPSGVVAYVVFRRRPGKPDALLTTTRAGATITTLSGLLDGVYALVLTAYDSLDADPATDPDILGQQVLTVLADGKLLATGSAAYDQRATDYLRAGRDGDRSLSLSLICFSRRHEVGALLAEGAPEAAHRLLRQPTTPHS